MNDPFAAAPAAEALGFNADTSIMFSDRKGRYRKGVERRQRKLAAKMPALSRFLRPDEQALMLATGCSPMSLGEQLFSGSMIMYLKRAMLVVTDKRILHIPTNYNYTYCNRIAEICYGDCTAIELKGRTLHVQYREGRKEKFPYIAGADRARLKALFRKLPLEGQASATAHRTHLCPRCLQALQEENYTCASCRLEFKSPAEGRKVALLWPGGGYFFTGHPVLGTLDAIAEAVLVIAVVTAVADTLDGIPLMMSGLPFFAAALLAEKAISVLHTNHLLKEFIPREKMLEPAAAMVR